MKIPAGITMFLDTLLVLSGSIPVFGNVGTGVGVGVTIGATTGVGVGVGVTTGVGATGVGVGQAVVLQD